MKKCKIACITKSQCLYYQLMKFVRVYVLVHVHVHKARKRAHLTGSSLRRLEVKYYAQLRHVTLTIDDV